MFRFGICDETFLMPDLIRDGRKNQRGEKQVKEKRLMKTKASQQCSAIVGVNWYCTAEIATFESHLNYYLD